MNLYVITVEDTVIQHRDYVVLAKDKDEAQTKVVHGLFLSESEPTTSGTLTTSVKDIVLIDALHGRGDEDENGNLLP